MLLLVSYCSGKATMQCGENEKYDSCGSKECDKKCKYDGVEEEDDEEPNVPCLVRVCHQDCVCEEGFYRNKDGKCVSAEDCELDNMEFIYPGSWGNTFHISAVCS
ncbi:trypsin Inhibitor like cysteine rich domain protein [Ancylostoma caninum]|uniref:Trypsin Inhibitor like cysteine rich domain protein n=1 Tax=Ancylostoma caninum TaxID=29170 RepID=A0A368FYT4_ANCCA|nr:trypsin Inhibitor like cysteine rich domain protein [Ancylostoma caninum]